MCQFSPNFSNININLKNYVPQNYKSVGQILNKTKNTFNIVNSYLTFWQNRLLSSITVALTMLSFVKVMRLIFERWGARKDPRWAWAPIHTLPSQTPPNPGGFTHALFKSACPRSINCLNLTKMFVQCQKW